MVQVLQWCTGRQDLIVAYISQLLVPLVAISIGVISSKSLGIEEYGEFVAIATITSMVTNIIGAQTGASMVFFKTRVGCFQLWREVIKIEILLVVILLVISALSSFFDGFMAIISGNFNEFYVYVLYGSVLFLQGSVQGIILAEVKYFRMAFISIVASLVKIVTLYLFIGDFTLMRLVLVFLISSVVELLLYYISAYSMLMVSRLEQGVVEKPLKKEIYYYVFKDFVSATLKAGNKKIDMLVLVLFFSKDVVGYFELLKKFFSLALFIVTPFSKLLLPKIRIAIENGNKISNLIVKSSLFIGVFYVISLAPIGFVFNYFYPEFIIESYSMQLIFSAVVVSVLPAITWWARPVAMSIDPSISLKANFLHLLLQLGLLFPLTVFFSLNGFMFAMFVSSFMLVFYWFYILKARVH